MREISAAEVARLLEEAGSEDGKVEQGALARIMPVVYDELRRLAQSYLARERAGHTLQATALVNEAYLRLASQSHASWRSRAHFLALAAAMIRRILIDHARARATTKRGGGHRLTLHDDFALDEPEEFDLLDLEVAMSELAQLNERQARVVELRFFGGLSVEEVAHVLCISPRTVKGDWRIARAWLRRRLGEGRTNDG